MLPPSLPGRFTITIPRRVTKSEALAVLEAALSMQGFATLIGPTGERQVLQIKEATSGAPWKGPVLDTERQNVITTMIDLEAAPAEDVLAKIQHLIGQADAVVPYAPSNSLILTGAERRVARMIELAHALDSVGEREVWVRTLRHRTVNEVAELVGEILLPPEGTDETVRREEVRVLAYPQTHSVIVIGDPEQIARARELIARFDQPAGPDTRIRVIRVYHRDVEELAKRLNALAIGRNLAQTRLGATETLLGKQFVVAQDRQTNSLIIDADPSTMATIVEVVSELDQALPRVQVDVIAYEITNPTELDLGFDWFLPALEPDDETDPQLNIRSNPSGGGLRGQIGPDLTFFGRVSRDPLVLPFVDQNGTPVEVVIPRETLVLTANSREVQSRVLMQPRMMVTTGEEQRLFVGQNIPIVTGAPDQGVTTSTRSTVDRQDVGVELIVTPTLGKEGTIILDVRLDISRVSLSVAGDPSQVGPTLENIDVETTIRLADGGLAVIGMSQEGTKSGRETGTPFLKDVPILGLLTEASSDSGRDTHLVFAVQARVMRTHEQDLEESIRQRLAVERSLSRVEGIRRMPGQPYAVLVATHSDPDEATTLAQGLEREGANTQIGRWENRGRMLFDVYLTGYRTLDHAGADALDLRERGFGPQVVVLPGETELASTPEFELLGERVQALDALGSPFEARFSE